SVTGTEPSRRLVHTGITFEAVFSPDGRFLSTAGADNRTVLWEVATGRAAEEYRLPNWALGSAFDRTGERLVVPGRDRSATVIERRGAPGGRRSSVLPHR